MPNSAQDIERIRAEFQECQRLLTALGDETRQYLVCILLMGDCRGSRVIEMAQQTNLSRLAISHHMQILKESGIVRARREGTHIYYYLDPQDSEVEKIIRLFTDIKAVMRLAPQRAEE